MTRLDVICPAAPWENDTTDADRAWDLCLSLSEEYGYAQVRQNGVIIGEYTDGGVRPPTCYNTINRNRPDDPRSVPHRILCPLPADWQRCPIYHRCHPGSGAGGNLPP
jgi:hypothetical protein